MSAVAVATIVTGNVALGLITLLRVIQRSERSLFRYRMWQARDDLVDKMLDGVIEPSKPAFEYIDRLELQIEYTDMITPFRLHAAYRILAAGGWSPPDDPLLERLSPDALPHVTDAMVKAHDARRRLLFLGSPSGWLAVALAVPVVYLQRVRRLVSRDRDRSAPTEDAGSDRSLDTVISWTRERYGTTTQLVAAAEKKSDHGHDHRAYA